MRAELAGAVDGLFAGLTPLPEGPPPLDEAETDGLVALASLAARARSGVERDPRTREIELILDAEAPARLAQTLRRLYGGMLVLGLDRAAAWPYVLKVGLDCMPKLRRGVLQRPRRAGRGALGGHRHARDAGGLPHDHGPPGPRGPAGARRRGTAAGAADEQPSVASHQMGAGAVRGRAEQIP